MTDRLAYILFRGLIGFFRLMPMQLAFFLAVYMGRIGYALDGRHRRIALDNLRHAFGEEKSEREIRKIARRCFENLALSIMEFVFIPRMRDRLARYYDVVDVEHVKEGLKRGKGVLLLLCHFGSWELLGLLSPHYGFPIVTVARPFKNRLIYGYIKKMRESRGMVVLEKKWVAREITKALRENKCLAIFADQRANRSGEKVEFFGRLAQTTKAPAIFARKLDPAVIPVFPVRLGPAKYLAFVEKPIPIIRTEDKDADIHNFTQAFTKVIEEYVRKYPEQWLWLHRRWRLSK